jgi:DNA modification methylase
MQNLSINPELKALIPPLTSEEFAQLQTNVLAEGIREPIITWQGTIVDGHNRYELAQMYDLPFKVKEMAFASMNHVKKWMAENQLGRRNLTEYVKGELIAVIEDCVRDIGKEKYAETVGRPQKESLSIIDNELKHNTQKIVAEKLGWSTGKKAMFDVVKKKAPEEIKEKLRQGDVSINQAYQEIKKEEKKAKFEEAKKSFEAEIKPVNVEQVIVHADSREFLASYSGPKFDLLLSDPPYGMDFKSGWSDKDKIANDKIEDTVQLFESVLAESVKHLKEDAHFYLFGSIDYVGELRPIIEKYLTLKNILIWDRKVIGMGDLKTYGKSFDVVYFGVNKKWRDLNGTRDRDLLSFYRCEPGKMVHPTEKPIDLLEYLIKKSTSEGDLILEPFAGGGSTLVAAKNTNRKCTGIEIEEKYVNLIKSRI